MFAPIEEWLAPGRPALEPHQIPPEGKWDFWLLEAGRGAGKTEACARYFAKYMHQHPGHRGRIIAPTYSDAVESCIEGPSGLKSVDPEIMWLPSAPGGSKVIWPNGSEALVLGTPFPKDVDRLRAGGNRHIDWWEEMAANVQLEKAWDQATLGLRSGDHPHAIGSTTPRYTKPYRAIRELPATIITHASIFDNPHSNKAWREKMLQRFEGTHLGEQELYGKLIGDIEGALWKHELIEASRVKEAPRLVRVVVALDPAATSGPEADDTGIVAGGLGHDGHVYILDDQTCHLGPDGWGERAVTAYETWKGDCIVGEVNNGGEMVEHVISTINPYVPFVPVHASRGKQTRAQPVASLYGSSERRIARVHHVGVFPELEDQLCTWVPGMEDSPDRLDALVWLVTSLLLAEEEEEEVYEHYEPVRIGPQI